VHPCEEHFLTMFGVALCDSPDRRSPAGEPSTALPMRRERSPSHLLFDVQLQRQHLIVLSRTEHRTCAFFLMLDHSTQRVYRL
jgi:hypothetical protein